MSAFLLSNNHVNSMVEFTRQTARSRFYVYHNNEGQSFDLNDIDQAASIGKALMAENVRSVNARYNDNEEVFYKYQRPAKKLTAVEMLKALDCYDYQTCETSDYDSTFAYKIIQSMRSIAIRSLSGYEEAPWGID